MTHFTFSPVNLRISIYKAETNLDWNTEDLKHLDGSSSDVFSPFLFFLIHGWA